MLICLAEDGRQGNLSILFFLLLISRISIAFQVRGLFFHLKEACLNVSPVSFHNNVTKKMFVLSDISSNNL